MSGRREAVRLRLEGRVQGVGFRWFTLRQARALGLAGRVRNLADGAVEVEAAGDPVDLARFKAALAEGPAGARVRRISEQPIAPPPAWKGFDVSY